jgi:DNA polymerase (family 10)
MPVHNKEITDSFERLADLLEVDGANPFRVRAYRNAARTIRSLPDPVSKMVEAGEDLSKLSGIGDDLAGKIRESGRDGKFPLLEGVKEKVPEGLSDVMALPGLGPKRAAQLRQKLDVEGIDDLAEAGKAGEVRDLEGFGGKAEQKIVSAIQSGRGKVSRFLRADLEEIVSTSLEYLRAISGVKNIVAAGSYRRKRATMGDLDILVTCARGTPVMERFVEYHEVREVISKGETKASVRLRSDLQVDLRVVRQVSYGAALFCFTGSKSHNIAVRKIAAGKKFKVNEYGVFRGEKRIAG